jgi:hypothetical protein
MAGGSKVFKPADVSESNASGYPEPFREVQRKRYNRRLGAFSAKARTRQIHHGAASGLSSSQCPAAYPPYSSSEPFFE